MLRNAVSIAAACAAAAAAAPSAAHHGFGSFDRSSDIELTGEVTGIDWVNPHAWLYIEVERDGGDVVPYRCEMRAATVLRRSGWSADMFSEGDTITISGHPDRDDENSCYVEAVTFADGSSIDRYGQRTPADPAEDPSERALTHANGNPNISGDWAQEQYVLSGGRLVPLSEVNEDSDEDRPFSPWEADDVELTELGQRKADNFDLRSRDNPRMRCETTSIIFDWTFDGPINRITQHEDRIVLEYGRYGFTRTIHMDLDEHPDDIEPSRAGHSIGHWEGNTLVVDTVGFEPGLIAPPVHHGERLHVVERFTLDTEDWTITREYEATDPEHFTDTYEGSDVVGLADVPYSPAECRELTFVDYGGEDAGQQAAERAEAAGDAAGRAADGGAGGTADDSAPAGDEAPWWMFWK